MEAKKSISSVTADYVRKHSNEDNQVQQPTVPENTLARIAVDMLLASRVT
jgi:hypothetical protein